jgi:predicted branched-subunit amino acid permease
VSPRTPPTASGRADAGLLLGPLRPALPGGWFRAGARDIAGPALGTAAMGLAVGAAMVHSGLPLPLVIAMSLTVFSSASQLVGAPLLAAAVPWPSVLLIALLLNVRFVVFSVQWRRYLGDLPGWQRLVAGYIAGDPIYACVHRCFPLPPEGQLPLPRRAQMHRYFLGAALTNWAVWQISSLLGMALADQLANPQALRFIGVLALLGLALPMLDRRPAWCAAAVAAGVVLACAGWPLGAPMVAAIAAAMLAGAAAERWGARA